jgi:predicted dehydrogenase
VPATKRTRRRFLSQTTALSASLVTPYFFTGQLARADETKSKNDRPLVGAIGLGGRGRSITGNASRFGDIAARCDVDKKHLGAEPNGKTHFTDYRKLLERRDIDVIVIATPDHWHTKIAIDAMKAGKDVYCEKPLTLTIDEGRLICKVVKQTGRVLQVGTQQRSEFGGHFLRAVAMIRDGRVGQLKRVIASTGGGRSGGPFKSASAPAHLDWNMWLGQAPKVPYTQQRCHVNFRWWREYAGGQMTDWGAHHVDIALWAMNLPAKGRLTLEGKGEIPKVENGFNMPAKFDVLCKTPGGGDLQLVTGRRQGVMFEGTKGNIFVNRGGLYGKLVNQLKDNPLPEDAIKKLYLGKRPGNHMGNFFECVKSRDLPISDAFSHHRSVTVLHLANLCLLLGRKLTWDLATEQIIGDDEGNAMQRRPQRKGFEISA